MRSGQTNDDRRHERPALATVPRSARWLAGPAADLFGGERLKERETLWWCECMTDQQNQQEELDLRSYFRPVWRRKWIILAIVVVATAATYLITSSQQKMYDSTTRVYVQTADPTLNLTQQGTQALPTTVSLADVAQLMTAQSVANAVARTLGIPVSSATAAVTATPSATSDFVTLTATSSSPQLAARLANTYVAQFLTSRQQLVRAEALRAENAAVATLKTVPSNGATITQRQTVLQQIESYREIALSPSAGARQIDAAVVPHFPASPQPVRDAVFGGAIGLILAVIVAFCLELLDRRLVRVSTVESIYGRHVLAVLPHVDNPSPMEAKRPIIPPQFLEELRSLRVMLRLSGDPEPPRTVIVTSTLPREGKSTVTRDLSLVYAEAGDRVLVIDGDLRRPNMAELFGVEAQSGLVHVLRGQTSIAEAAVPVVLPTGHAEGSTNGHAPAEPSNDPSMGGSVDVLTHGEQLHNPLPLLSSDRMVALLKEASEAYDIVLLDTPPVLTVVDSVPLLEVVDSVLLVARLGQTTRDAASRFTELVERLSGVTFSGVVANDRRDQFDDEGYGSYGRYGYGYYYGTKRGERKKQTTATAS
jgi:succinoglycan biosynthesis transport protein ExoP